MNELFSLKGKVAVVTGGTGVLGGAMVLALADAGAKVAVIGRRREAGEKVVSDIEKRKGEAIAIAADVLQTEELKNAEQVIVTKWGKIDILVNAAGGNMPGATIMPDKDIFSLNPEDLRKVIDLNYFGTVYPTQVFSRQMAKQKSGVIINISSVTASRVLTRVMGYSSSKASIENYTKWMAVEMAFKFGEGIRVNAIAPGFFIGEQNRSLLLHEDGSYTERGQKVIDHTPMKRFGQPEELGGTLVWLCSDAARFVTGAVIPVDGGFSCFSGV